MDKLKLVPVPGQARNGGCNVYYNPEAFGLEQVSELSYTNEPYEFNYRVVWKDTEGRLWTASDSGCSCPTPFEGTTELDRVFSLDELADEYREDGVRRGTPTPSEWQAFKREVQRQLTRLKGKES